MTQKELSRLQNIQKEIRVIQRQINDVGRSPRDYNNAQYVFDKVKGSTSSYPYVETNFKVEGYDFGNYYAKLNRLKEKLGVKLNELMDERDRVTNYIETVDDTVIRMILTLKYINGLTWYQIGMEIGYSDRQVKRKHKKFFENKGVD